MRLGTFVAQWDFCHLLDTSLQLTMEMEFGLAFVSFVSSKIRFPRMRPRSNYVRVGV